MIVISRFNWSIVIRPLDCSIVEIISVARMDIIIYIYIYDFNIINYGIKKKKKNRCGEL